MPKIMDKKLEEMKPWERAEYLAEIRRMEKEAVLADMTARYGAPEIVGAEGTMREFTLPDMSRRTYTEKGDLTSCELPPHYTNRYSPYDQKKLERFYQARSQVSTDPEVTEDERQQAFDEIDAAISKIPTLAPIMAQPSPQHQAESNIVNIDGTKYFYDGKSLKPLEAPKAQQDKQKLWWNRYGKIYDAMVKRNENIQTLPKDRLTQEQIHQEAKRLADLEVGSLEIEAPVEDRLFGLRRGEGKVTADGRTVSVYKGQVTPEESVNQYFVSKGLQTGEFEKPKPAIPRPKTKEEFDVLASGTVYLAPDGSLRRKP